MLVYQEQLGLLILAGVICACILGGILIDDHRDLFYTQYHPSLPDGTSVAITAIVHTIQTTSTGNHLIISLEDDNKNSIPLQLFIPNSVAHQIHISPGDKITAYGALTTYRNEKELVISSIRDLSIVYRAGF